MAPRQSPKHGTWTQFRNMVQNLVQKPGSRETKIPGENCTAAGAATETGRGENPE
jgi:hypothetical protein